MRRFTLLAVPFLIVVSLLGALPGVSSSQAGMAQALSPTRGTESGVDSSVMFIENAGQSTTLVAQPSSLSSSTLSSSVIDARCPDVAAAPGEGVIVAWNDNRSGYRIYTRRFDTHGAAVWPEVVQSSVGSSACPSLVVDDAGDGLVAWSDGYVWAQKLDPTGHPDWPQDQQLYSLANNAKRVAATTDGHDNWYVTWDALWTSCYGVPCQDVWLAKLGSEPWNRNMFSVAAEQPMIAAAADGTLRLAYLHRTPNVTYEGYVRSLRADGSTIWGSGILFNGYMPPVVAVNATGDTYVAWQDWAGPDPVRVQKLNGQTGAPLWGEGVEVSGSGASRLGAAIAVAPEGGVYVVWPAAYPSDPNCSGYYCTRSGVYAQKLTPDGQPVWPKAVEVNDTQHALFDWRPSTEVDQLGDLYVVWTARLRKPLDDMSGYDVYMQSVSPDGVRRWATDTRIEGADIRSVFLPTLLKNYMPDLNWQVETVKQVAEAPQTPLSMVLDTNGMPEFVYGDSITESGQPYARLQRMFWDQGAWRSEIVEKFWSGGVTAPSLALDHSGTPHIGYCAGSDNPLRPYHSYRGLAGWMTELLPLTSLLACFSPAAMALDHLDRPHMSYKVGWPLEYAYRDAAGWHVETADPSQNASTGGPQSLKLDADDRPHLTYQRSYEQAPDELVFAYRDASGWHSQIVDSGSDIGEYSALVIDKGGRPHVVYSGQPGSKLWYAHLDATGWHREMLTTDGSNSFSLALTSSGQVQVSYTSQTKGDLRYGRRIGDGWHLETVAAKGWGSSFALDTDDRPHIVFYDATAKMIKYARVTTP